MTDGRFGTAELLILIVLAAAYVIGWWKIFSRAGYPGLLSVAMYIPVVNVLAFLFLAFFPWPIEDQNKELLAQQMTPER